MLYSLTLNP